MSTKVYHQQELHAALIRDFAGAWLGVPLFFNQTYCAVTKEWVEDEFAPYFVKVLAARKQITWQRRGNQCEHFALRAGLEAVDLFSQMPEADVPAEVESVAVAAIMYQSRAGTPTAVMHEVSLWFIGGFWREWEPQTRRWLNFTTAERQTAQRPIIF